MPLFEIEQNGRRFEVEAPDQQTALEALGQMEAPAAPQREYGAMDFVNQGIAGGIGSIPDAVGSAIEGVGMANTAISHGIAQPLDIVAQIMGGGEDFFSQNIPEPMQIGRVGDTVNRAMDAVGVNIAPPEEQPDTLGEHAAAGFGGAAGGLVPFTGLAGAFSSSASPVVRGAGDAIMAPFVNTPARGIAAELAAGTGAGVGMDVGQRVAPDNPISPLVGAILGGAAGGAGTYGAIQGAQRLPMVGLASRMAASEIAPFTRTGATERGRSRVTGLAEDPNAARAAISEPTIGNLSPAVATGDRRLMGLEQTVRNTDPAVDMRMRQSELDSGELLRAAFREPAQGAEGSGARQFMQEMIEREIGGLTQSMDDTFGRPMGVENVSTALRTGSQPARSTAYDAAYATPIDYTTDAGRNLESLIGRVERAAPGAIATANRLIAGDVDAQDVRQIMADVGPDGSVTFRDQPTTQQIDYITRALNHMASSGEGQGALGGTTDVGRVMGNLATSIRTSLREANPLYGEALETAATPIGQRQALLFGQELLRPGTPRDVAAAQIAEMTAPELAFVRQGVRSQLDETLANVRRTLSNPDVGMGQAQQALRDMSSDAVRQKIGMILPEDQARAFFEQLDSVAGLLDTRRSGPAAFANARPDEEIQSLLRAQDTGAAAAQLMAQAANDTSGRAAAGVKGAFLDHLMRDARSGFGDDGSPLLSGRGLQGALNNPRVAAIANEVLSPEEQRRTAQIISELTRLESMQGGGLPGVGGVMDGEPNSVVAYIARVIAARTGAQAGQGTSGASLQTAQMASQRMQRILEGLTLDRAEGLIREAIQGDRELFDALLVPPGQLTAQQESRLSEVLTRTAVGTTGGVYGADTEGEPSMEDLIMQGEQ